jgi:integrase
MKTGLPNLLGAVIRDYFTDHLPRLRGTSPHTIHSYRDSMVLLLRFLSRQRNKPITALDLTDLDPPGILAFLSHLEQERKNGVSTRNVRLSAIHAFFHFVASRNPEHLELAQRVLGIPFSNARDNEPSITWNTRRLTRFSKRSTGPPRKAAVIMLCWRPCSTPAPVSRRSPNCAPVISN